MKYVLDSFDQLQDLADYLGRGYLNQPLSPNALDQISYLNGAFCFLLDRNFFKENASNELGEAIKNSLRSSFDSSKLTDLAVSIQNQSSDDGFLKGPESFNKYYQFIVETESYVESAKEDEYGRMTLVYLKTLSTIIESDTKNMCIDSLKINEIVFLNGTYTIMLILKGFLGLKFNSIASFEYFDTVSDQAEVIRSQILD